MPGRLLPARFAITTVAAAAAIATAATITAEAAAISAEATAAAAAATAILARLGFVDLQWASANFLAIELVNSSGAFFFGGHLDEAEASRATRFAIFDDARRFDRSCLSEQLLQILACSLESQIPNIKFH